MFTAIHNDIDRSSEPVGMRYFIAVEGYFGRGGTKRFIGSVVNFDWDNGALL